MRQIKFRAQDVASNKWLYGDLRHHTNDVCIFEQGGTKREQIRFLYQQLDKCGQIIAETEPGPERSRYNREYRGIINALRRLEPEKWKDYPAFRQHTTEGRNEMVQKFLAANRCPKCGGEFKQTRSGSFRIVCQQCGQKAQLKRKNK